MELVKQENLELRVDQISSDFIEAAKASREVMLVAYYKLGADLSAEINNYGDRIVQRVAESIGRSERTVYYAIKFAEKFTDFPQEFSAMPWRKLIQEQLTEPSDPKPEPKKKIMTCPNCFHQFEI